MSSTIDHEAGVVTITAPYSWAEPGRRLFLHGSWAQASARERRLRSTFEDYLARVALSRASHANNVGVTVRADESALLELIEGGAVHPALLEEPKARAA
jgi:hypothetical protein